MEIKNVVVIGGGVLGSQIAYQAAYCGFDVTIWLRSEGSIGRCQPKLDHLKEVYHDTITLMDSDKGKTPQNWAMGISDYEDFDKEKCLEKANKAYENIKLELDLQKAVSDADLIIESMAENVEQKIDIYKKMADLLPEKTVIVTNSSTLLPSKFAKYTKRPEKYLSLHFANSIWKNNMTEVMAQKQTDQKYFNLIMDFAKEIRMIPLPVRKEKSGYLLNSMLVPLLFSGMDLYVNGISDPESIDKAWTLGTGAPKGPFQILDTVGLTTAYNIVSMYLKVPSFLAPYNFKGMAKMLKIYIDEGYRNLQKSLCEACNVDSVEKLNEIYDAYFIICDYNTYNYQLKEMIKHLKGKFIYEYIVNPGEESKSLEDYQKIMEYCIKVNLSRKSLIIALGGGVVGDLAGFVAATWMRGIRYVNCPTSLLAMVDASTGGKTGINSPQG